jgi:hypothetical protein
LGQGPPPTPADEAPADEAPADKAPADEEAMLPSRADEAPAEVLRAAARGCPSGLLGKLACASKEIREACMDEARRRAAASGAPIPPGGVVRAPPVSLRLLESAGEVEWALTCGVQPSARLADALAAGGSVPALARAVELGAPLDVSASYAAVRHGRLDVLKWAHANGASILTSVIACGYAALAGQLDVLKWCRERGAPWDEFTCGAAAEGGHLDVLEWARAEGCPWDEFTCCYAAGAGHLDVLRWARERGCPWDRRVCDAAARGGHLAVLAWAGDNGAPQTWFSSCCATAAFWGNLDVLRWAVGRGHPWCSCVAPGEACRCAPALAAAAEARGHAETAAWIRRELA